MRPQRVKILNKSTQVYERIHACTHFFSQFTQKMSTFAHKFE